MKNDDLPTAIDTLLLAIIDAHDAANPTATREGRLTLAKEALFGERPRRGRPKVDDRRALVAMGYERIRTIAPVVVDGIDRAFARWMGKSTSTAPPSVEISNRRFARKAARLAGSSHAPDAVEHRLRSKFRRLTTRDLAQLEEALMREEQDQATVLEILRLLEKLGVGVELPLGE